MKLFFKHLFESIKRKPAQPLVMIITLAIAVGVSVMSFCLNDCFAEEKKIMQSESSGRADLTLSLNGTSKSRFMFTDEVEKILGERASIAGIYEAPILCGEQSSLYFGVGVDFFEIQNIFDFSFSEYGEVNRANLSEIAFVSASFAKEMNLSVGESFSSRLLGSEKNYTVAAISPASYMGKYDVMVDIGGVVDVLSADSLFVSSLGNMFRPCSTVYIDVKDGYSLDECKQLLSNSSDYSDKTVFALSENIIVESDIQTMRLLVSVVIGIVCTLSVAVTFCCFYILAAERADENASFRAAGARSLHLNLLQYAEILIYWLVGSALGLGLGYLLLKFTIAYAGFEYVKATLSVSSIVISLGLMLFTSLATATSFIITAGSRKTKKTKSASLPVVLLGILAMLTYAAVCIIPFKNAFLPGLIAMLAVFIFAFAIARPLIRMLMRGIDRFFEKRLVKNGRLSFYSLRYAVKNVFSVKVLHNFSRLFALLIAVLLSCFLVIVSSDGYVLAAEKMLSADYVVLNSAESCQNKLLASNSVESASKSFFGSARVPGGRYTPAISVEDAEMLSDLVGVKKMPSGNEAVFCIGQAEANGFSVGDSVEINVDGELYEVTVLQITDCGTNVIIFDSEYFGIAPNMILVKGKAGLDKDELLIEISEATALEVATIASPDELVRQRIGSIDVYLNTGDVLLVIAIIFSAIGMLDNLIQSYRERRPEFELYCYAGMPSNAVRKMKVFEVIIAVAFGFLMGAMAFVAASVVIDIGLSAYGYKVFNALAMLFK